MGRYSVTGNTMINVYESPESAPLTVPYRVVARDLQEIGYIDALEALTESLEARGFGYVDWFMYELEVE